MKIKNRQQLLIIGVILVVAFFVGDKLILTPLGNLWTARSKKIAELKNLSLEEVQIQLLINAKKLFKI